MGLSRETSLRLPRQKYTEYRIYLFFFSSSTVMCYTTSMNVLRTSSGQPHRNARDWPYHTYLLIRRLHLRGRTVTEIAKAAELTWDQVRRFIDTCFFSPVGGYADLKRRLDADLALEAKL